MRASGSVPQTDDELRQVVRALTPELIVNAVEELLMVQRGRELGYSLGDEQFQDILNGIKEENGLDDAQLLEALERDEGMTLAELRESMERQMRVNQVEQIEILGRVSITDTEAREYYETHLEEFTDPTTVTLREILIAVSEQSGALDGARDDRARALAASALERVLAGEDFGLVASEVSDAASQANGGLIGPIELADLAGPVRERIETLEVGAVGDVQRTITGYQILKLEAATQPTATAFDEVREGIAANVFSERRLRALREYLNRLRNEAIVEWMDEGSKSLYDEYLGNRDIAGDGF